MKDTTINYAGHISHNDAARATPAKTGNIARDGGKPKAAYVVPVHPGMQARSRKDGTTHTHATAADFHESDSGNPLQAGPPRGKDLKPVGIVPGMRSRTTPGLNSATHQALGATVFNNAAMDGQDRVAYGITQLPNTTKGEN